MNAVCPLGKFLFSPSLKDWGSWMLNQFSSMKIISAHLHIHSLSPRKAKWQIFSHCPQSSRISAALNYQWSKSLPFIFCKESNSAVQAGLCPFHFVQHVSNPGMSWCPPCLLICKDSSHTGSQLCRTASCLWDFNQSDTLWDETAWVLDLIINLFPVSYGGT